MCKIDDTHKDEMEFEMVGITKPVPKYYHKSCWQERLKEKELIKKENEELDKLVETIYDIFGVKFLPDLAYAHLANMRNGNKDFGKDTNKSRKGYTYDVIEDTFKFCRESIEWANSNKNFNGFMNAFKYSLAVVADKLAVVEQRKVNRENHKIMIKKHKEQMESIEVEEFEPSFKKKPSSNNADITEFLDD